MNYLNTYKSIIIAGVLLIISFGAFAYTNSLRISLLTQDKGDEMYAYFGHTAIRVTDDSLNIDKVYNYGTFDFNTPNFYIRFIKGDLDYCLSIDDFDYFVYFSNETKRTIREQELVLSFEDKVNLVNSLDKCYTSSARYYRYDFLKNNCATKIRDIIEEATNNKIDFSNAGYQGKTFRQLLKPFVSRNYWVDFGINLVMGIETDKMASSSDYMFLPIYIHSYLEECDCAKNSTIILDASQNTKTKFKFSYILPWIIISLLILLSFWKKTKIFVLYFISIIFGLLGILILFLSLYSLHPALSQNFNILWTLPALLLLFFRNKKINDYFKLSYILLISVFISFQNIITQELSFTFIPWMILMIVICILDLKIIKKRIYKG